MVADWADQADNSVDSQEPIGLAYQPMNCFETPPVSFEAMRPILCAR